MTPYQAAVYVFQYYACDPVALDFRLLTRSFLGVEGRVYSIDMAWFFERTFNVVP